MKNQGIKDFKFDMNQLFSDDEKNHTRNYKTNLKNINPTLINNQNSLLNLKSNLKLSYDKVFKYKHNRSHVLTSQSVDKNQNHNLKNNFITVSGVKLKNRLNIPTNEKQLYLKTSPRIKEKTKLIDYEMVEQTVGKDIDFLEYMKPQPQKKTIFSKSKYYNTEHNKGDADYFQAYMNNVKYSENNSMDFSENDKSNGSNVNKSNIKSLEKKFKTHMFLKQMVNKENENKNVEYKELSNPRRLYSMSAFSRENKNVNDINTLTQSKSDLGNKMVDNPNKKYNLKQLKPLENYNSGTAFEFYKASKFKTSNNFLPLTFTTEGNIYNESNDKFKKKFNFTKNAFSKMKESLYDKMLNINKQREMDSIFRNHVNKLKK